MFLFCLYQMQNYLDNFWPDLKAAHELCDSILQSRRERENESQESHGKEYAEHLPLEVLEAGIKSGRYIQVRVVMRHRRWDEPACFLLSFMASHRPLISEAVNKMGMGKPGLSLLRTVGGHSSQGHLAIWFGATL